MTVQWQELPHFACCCRNNCQIFSDRFVELWDIGFGQSHVTRSEIRPQTGRKNGQVDPHTVVASGDQTRKANDGQPVSFPPQTPPGTFGDLKMKWTTLTAALVLVAGSSVANAGLFRLHRHTCCDSAPSCAAPCADACGAGPSCAAPCGAGNGCGAAPTCAAPCGAGNGCGAAPTCAAPCGNGCGAAPTCAAPAGCGAAPTCAAPVAACCAPAPADCCAPTSCCKPRKCCNLGSLLKKCRLPKLRCKSSCCDNGCDNGCGAAPSCAAPCGAGNGCGAAPTCAAPAGCGPAACGPSCAAPCGACN